jgi:hypothetical protein
MNEEAFDSSQFTSRCIYLLISSNLQTQAQQRELLVGAIQVTFILVTWRICGQTHRMGSALHLYLTIYLKHFHMVNLFRNYDRASVS